MRLQFPKNFYWGAATAAHQVEGNNHNDWSEWEKANAKRLAKEATLRQAQGKKWPDYILNPAAAGPNPLQEENYISGKACDHYNRFREDFDIAKSLGHNAHRFSIEWSRIEPEEGKFDEKEIEHYRQVILALREWGIEPFVTLWHWTNPVWFAKKGGWLNKASPKYFERYITTILRSYGSGIVKFWVPLNEPNVYTGLSYIAGTQPPEMKNLLKARKVSMNLISAYKIAYRLIHSLQKNSQVGISHFETFRIPERNLFINRILVKTINRFANTSFLEETKNFIDFIGIQYYRPELVNFKFGGNRLGIYDSKDLRNGESSDMGWGIYPEGLYHILKKMAGYSKPIIICENGIADARDILREKFIKDHLYWIHRAIQEGVDVRGYFHWSLLDNFEFVEGRGFWPRFGLVEIDYKTMKRKIRNSALEYKKICVENALDPVRSFQLK